LLPLSSCAQHIVLGPSSVARENGQRPFWRRRFCHLKKALGATEQVRPAGYAEISHAAGQGGGRNIGVGNVWHRHPLFDVFLNNFFRLGNIAGRKLILGRIRFHFAGFPALLSA
jgi:hypothetical protein